MTETKMEKIARLVLDGTISISVERLSCHACALPQNIFAALVDRATTIVSGYRTDMYHDALWIERHSKPAHLFYYCVSEGGTSIGEDLDLVARREDYTGSGALYRVEVSQEDRIGIVEVEISSTFRELEYARKRREDRRTA